jgi:hypothetical protein
MSFSKFFSKLCQVFLPARSDGDGSGSEAATAANLSVPGKAGPARALDDDFESAFDAVFGEAESDGSSAGAEDGKGRLEQSRLDREQNQELFAGIAANHARPVKDFMFELEAGSAPKEWIEVCRPILASLIDAAESMELWKIAKIITSLDKELKEAQKDHGPWPSKSWSERILFLYSKLVELHPDAFVVDEADRRRESIIIHSLLRQIPGVGYVTLEKLYRVGLTSRETLFHAGPRDLVTTAGIPEELSGLICLEVQAYRDRTEGASPEELQKRGMQRLRERVPELRSQHDAFLEACDAVDTKGRLARIKRAARARRRELVLEIDLLLAEMGQVELVRELQSNTFGQRIQRLEQLLASPTEAPAKSVSDDGNRETSPTTVET